MADNDDVENIKTFFQSVPGLIVLGVAALAILGGVVWAIVAGVL